MKSTLVIVSLVLILAGMGCVSLSSLITPATIEPRAVDYAFASGIVHPDDFEGYQNLDKALKLETAVTSAHQVNQLGYQQMIDKDQLDYAQLNDVVVQNRASAVQREQALFGEDGLLTLGLSMAGFGSLTGLIGLMRKRPGDITKEEMATAVESVNGEVTDKDRQLIELIRGIQAFIDEPGSTPPMVANLKILLGQSQSADTKVKVAKVKATI